MFFFLKIVLTAGIFAYPFYKASRFRNNLRGGAGFFRLQQDFISKSFRIFTSLITAWVLYLVLTSDNPFEELINPLLLLAIALAGESWLRNPKGIWIKEDGIYVYDFVTSYFPTGSTSCKATEKELILTLQDKEGEEKSVKFLEKNFPTDHEYRRCVSAIRTRLKDPTGPAMSA